MMENNTKQAIQSEWTVEEVNVYSRGCGTPKAHCVIDCEVTMDCMITCDR